MDALGGMNLQSGFVLAAIILAVFWAERYGGTDELARRLFQVSLGVVAALGVLAATTAFVRPPELPGGMEGAFSDTFGDGTGDDEALDFFQDTAERNQIATTIHAAAGILFVVAGLGLISRFRTTAVGVALGGLLLLLFGGVHTDSGTGDALGSLFSVFGAMFGGAGASSRGYDIAYFLVLAGGAVVLVVFGVGRWDAEPRAAAPAAEGEPRT